MIIQRTYEGVDDTTNILEKINKLDEEINSLVSQINEAEYLQNGDSVTSLNITSQQPWQLLTTINGWINYDATGASFAKLSYYKDSNGTVWLQGFVKSGTGIISTLPAGYRPGTPLYPRCYSGESSFVDGGFKIDKNGAITPYAGSNTFFEVRASFRAEQ